MGNVTLGIRHFENLSDRLYKKTLRVPVFFWNRKLQSNLRLKNSLKKFFYVIFFQVFKAAQPALLYLVPFTLLPLFVMAYLKGDLKTMWHEPFAPAPASTLTTPLTKYQDI